MIYRIDFTLVGSDEWLFTKDCCDFISEIQMEERVAYIIGTKLRCEGISGHAKKVKLYSEKGELIGESSDISEIGNLKFYNKQNLQL